MPIFADVNDTNLSTGSQSQPKGPSGALDIGASSTAKKGNDKTAAQAALAGIPGHAGWQVTGVPQAEPGNTGNWQWNVVGPNGEPDVFTVNAQGSVVTPPQKTPSKDDSLTIEGPDSNGEFWVIDKKNPSNPTKIQGIKGKAAQDNPYPGGVERLDDGSIVGIKADGTTKEVVKATTTGKPMTAYEKANIDLQTRKTDADEKAQAATEHARAVAADIDAKLADLKQQDMDETVRKDKFDELYKQGQQALQEAQTAQQVQRDANDAWYQHQQIGIQQQQNDISQQKTDQDFANQNDQTAISAAGALETNRHNLQSEKEAQAQTGSSLIQQRAQQASGLLNNWVNAAAGNKNFGLGGADLSGLGPGLMGDAMGFATKEMGGQGIMDAAAQMVHAANPELSGTPEGAQYTALLSQMLEKKMNPNAPQQQGTTGASGVANPAGPVNPNKQTSSPSAAVVGGTPDRMADQRNPSDPDFLGKTIAAALGHLGGFTVGPNPDRQVDNRQPQFGGV